MRQRSSPRTLAEGEGLHQHPRVVSEQGWGWAEWGSGVDAKTWGSHRTHREALRGDHL